MVRYAVSGTPTDCVKLAVDKLITRRPALLISGINHGSNASNNVIYSANMGAAIEGCLHDIPSIGLSLWSHDKDADFSRCLPHFEEIIKKALAEPLPQGICLNVNAPRGDIKGVKVCRQADGRWANEYQQDSDETVQKQSCSRFRDGEVKRPDCTPVRKGFHNLSFVFPLCGYAEPFVRCTFFKMCGRETVPSRYPAVQYDRQGDCDGFLSECPDMPPVTVLKMAQHQLLGAETLFLTGISDTGGRHRQH